MFYLENYSIYRDIIEKGFISIKSKDITKENWKMHYTSIVNLMKDGIETEYMTKPLINIVFENNLDIDLTIPDYFFNLIMWSCLVNSNLTIQPKHVFFDPGITLGSIKKFIDINFIKVNRKLMENMKLNNIIDDCIVNFRDVDLFSYFLANTINLYDFITLMNENEEFNSLVHSDLTGYPIGEVHNEGMRRAKRSIDIIMESEHCLCNFFRAKQGANVKQYKEVAINIGSKPNGRGGAYPAIANTNFITGGVNDLVSFAMESSGGRTAQIIVDGNVGESGYFARLLGLNNSDSFKYPDPHYSCNTKNFQELQIENIQMIDKLKNRYYRLNPNGIDYIIDETAQKNMHLIGKKIYLRSPMTCASAAAGHGICYKCYGDLAYTNTSINIGKIASELLSAALTQMMLSAKHLLESAIKEMKWVHDFEEFFDADFNTVKVQDIITTTPGYKIIIDPDEIDIDSEDNVQNEYNEYITKFILQTPTGKLIDIYTEEMDKLYISNDLNNHIRSTAKPVDGKIVLDLKGLEDLTLFVVQIYNKDLSETLKKVKDVIDKTSTVKELNRHSWLQTMISVLIENDFSLDSIHAEVILMNQLRSTEDILNTPSWEYPNEDCVMMTLKQALANHPSVTIGLSYQSVNKMLYNPLTFRKNKPSFMDLFFMEQPQVYLNKNMYTTTKSKEKPEVKKDKDGLYSCITRVDKE